MAGVDLFFGPMLIGVLLNTLLYGALVTQMLAYYQRFTNDLPFTRYLILYLFIVETANLVVECGIIYEPLIIRYGTKAAVTVSPILLPGDAILISIVSAPIQIFAAWRISGMAMSFRCVIILNTTNPTVITGSFILPGIIALVSIGSFAAGINMSVKVFLNPEFQEFGSFIAAATVWLALGAVCDVVIAVGMSYALYTRKTGFSTVDGQINRIIRLTLETGSLTAIAALLDVTLFLVFPQTSMNFIVDFPLSSLYACSVLAMLNSRHRKKSAESEAEHAAQTALRFQSFHNSKQTTVNFPSLLPSHPPSQEQYYEHEHRSAKHNPYPSAS
ncbi:hypothetical protein C8J57DRAFT_1542016 [Mycena rebaudengoi]|nr:hypothetical protein C8J57DRAFT_1542016 [Mycena rebaudengoi]